jgi:hypothetical protein
MLNAWPFLLPSSVAAMLPYAVRPDMNPHALTHDTHTLNTLPQPQGRRLHAPGLAWLSVEPMHE